MKKKRRLFCSFYTLYSLFIHINRILYYIKAFRRFSYNFTSLVVFSGGINSIPTQVNVMQSPVLDDFRKAFTNTSNVSSYYTNERNVDQNHYKLISNQYLIITLIEDD